MIGDVLHLWVRDELVDERYRINHDLLRAIGRLAGAEYCRTGDRFSMTTGERPATVQAK